MQIKYSYFLFLTLATAWSELDLFWLEYSIFKQTYVCEPLKKYS